MKRSTRYRQSAAGVIALVSVALVGTGPATASPGPSSDGPAAAPTPNSTVSGIQAQVAALETQIAQQQQQVASLSEQFDQSTVHLQQVQARLAMIHAQLATDRRAIAGPTISSRWTPSTPTSTTSRRPSLSTLFSSTSSTGALHNEYQDTAIGNVDAAAAAVQSDERHLVSTEGRLRAEVHAGADGDDSRPHRLSKQPRAPRPRPRRTLSAVKGQLAQMIAQQAAAAGGPRGRPGGRRGQRRGASSAAQQAAEDAQVAQTVGAGSAAATAATNSANQAAGVRRVTGVVGNGEPETAAGGRSRRPARRPRATSECPTSTAGPA